eukprot:COSAG02_NODE_63529_length_263_cov_0.609756_1_plen_20_part_10
MLHAIENIPALAQLRVAPTS